MVDAVPLQGKCLCGACSFTATPTTVDASVFYMGRALVLHKMRIVSCLADAGRCPSERVGARL